MAALDWIALAVVAVSLLVGAWRGLVFEVLSLAGWLLAFWSAYAWSTELAAHLPMGESREAWRLAAAFVIIFLGVVFAVGLVASLLRKLLAFIGLGPIDRALGALFGVARGLLLLLVLAVVLRLVGFDQAPWRRESHSSVWLAQGLATIEPWLPEAFAQMLHQHGQHGPVVPPEGLLQRAVPEGVRLLRAP
ncbi:MAG: Colicin V production protein [Paracidovorax wautersii]|uniref:Colicin V production protein n=1 Tax=Paracidovorax wautersii TaxID=1177982 RepID=A0A7V8JRW7_9BURK|nr:MAG: Colicin V production protein [Paracidovorax wautersii]